MHTLSSKSDLNSWDRNITNTSETLETLKHQGKYRNPAKEVTFISILFKIYKKKIRRRERKQKQKNDKLKEKRKRVLQFC